MNTTTNQKLLHHKIYHLHENAQWLVFVHGAGGSLTTWKYQVEAFKPYFNLLLLDLRDHGLSKNINPEFQDYNFDIVCDDIIYLLEHLKIYRAHFMSLSLGSVILQKLDEKRPDLIDRMIMAGGVFKATFKMKVFVHSAKALNYILPYRWMYDLFSWIVLPRKNHAHSRRIFRLQSHKLLPNEYLKWVGLYKDFFRLLRQFFHREMRKICLVVMGEEDHVFFNAAKRFVSKQRNATIVVFEKCGHICNIDEPERFNRIALKFLLGKETPVSS